MKKRLFVLVFILFFIGLTFISAQDPNSIEGIGVEIVIGLAEGDDPSESKEDVLDRIRQKRNDSDNGYLISQWKDQLLDNENIAAVNAVFAENDIIFRILFGVPYELSLTMFFIIVLWFCILLGLPDIIDSIDFFNRIQKFPNPTHHHQLLSIIDSFYRVQKFPNATHHLLSIIDFFNRIFIRLFHV